MYSPLLALVPALTEVGDPPKQLPVLVAGGALALVAGALVLVPPRLRGQHAGCGQGALTVAYLVRTCTRWPTEDPDATREPLVEVADVSERGMRVSDHFPVHECREDYTGRHRLATPA